MKIGIVGAGFAGLGMAIQLGKQGHDDVTLFEEADRLGGTWRANAYPGSACDIPSHLYSFSFEIKRDWSRAFAEQAEIQAYLEHCADKYDVRRRIRFSTAVEGARFDDVTRTWRVRTRDGEEHAFDVLITACGQLGRPAIPALPGVERFRGPHFHSAAWRHDVDLAGKDVVVVGAGASAIQFVPPVAAKARRLTLFQRTPPWVLPKPDRAYGGVAKAIFRRLPFVQAIHRALLYVQHEFRYSAFQKGNFANRVVRWLATRHLAAQVSDRALRERLLPSYTPGCKRLLISNEWYPTLARKNVTVVSTGIREVTEDAVVDADGTRHAADAILYGTGFRSTEILAPMQLVGRDGRRLEDYGPNTNLGHNSIIFMLEAQIRYVLSCLALLADGGTLDVKPERQRAFDEEMQTRLAQSVWTSGCTNWYQNEAGKGVNNWPGYTLEYWRRTRSVDASAYELSR
jgi:cation diffusion facilitator CzcD-associated flavoprotein CzcO